MLLSTPIKLNQLRSFLAVYNPQFTKTLILGFSYGFHLHSPGSVNCNESRNLPSALANNKVVDQKLSKELAACRIAGPFPTAPFHPEFHPLV